MPAPARLTRAVPARPPRARLLGPLLPDGIVTVESTAAADTRQRTFEAGRRCAALAAARLGCDGSAIGVCADRRPLWPPGFTGSITHTAGYAAAAMGRKDRYAAIGIDVERTGQLTPDLWSRIMGRRELDAIRALPPARRAVMATVVFSAKEAFYKAQFELVRQWLEFHDVAVALAPETNILTIKPGVHLWISRLYPGPLPVRYAMDERRVATALALPAQ